MSARITPDQSTPAIMKPKAGIEDGPREQEFSLGKAPRHFLDLLCDRGYYKTVVLESPESKSASKPGSDRNAALKSPLYLTVNVLSLKDIDAVSECFSVEFRLYAFWRVNLHTLGMADVANRARQAGHYCVMTDGEKEEFCAKSPVPVMTVFNMIEDNGTNEVADIRVYGGETDNTGVLWNKLYNVVCREAFELHDFPFDCQRLQIELRNNSTSTWDLFDVRVNAVQFHRKALEASEWAVLEPTVKRGCPPHKVSLVDLHVKRKSMFYLQNVVFLTSLLTLLGLVTFMMPIDDVGGRVGNVFTMILTAVALKFVLAGSLPKVPYNTKLDYFLLGSFVELAVMAVMCAIPHLLDNSIQTKVNNYVAIVLGTSYGLFVVTWWIIVEKKTWKQHFKTIRYSEEKAWYFFLYSDAHFLPALA